MGQGFQPDNQRQAGKPDLRWLVARYNSFVGLEAFQKILDLHLARVQVEDAQRPEMLRLRAAVESASGNLDAANRDLKEALTLAPGNVNSLVNFGTL